MLKSDSESRRVRMTKRMLKDALMELMEKQPLAAISVTELCDLADVNRSTFYSYYNDMIELLEEIQQDIVEKIPTPSANQSMHENNAATLQAFTSFFAYVRAHARDFSILLHAGDSHFTDKLIETIFSYFRNPVIEIGTENMIRWGYIFAINGVIGMMKDWMDRNFPVSDEEFAKVALEMSFRANDFEYSYNPRKI